jgi:hypothetical protein
MRTGLLAARAAEAQARVMAAAQVLAQRFALEAPAAVQGPVRDRDADHRAMVEREAIADLLEALVAATEAESKSAPAPGPERESRSEQRAAPKASGKAPATAMPRNLAGRRR